MKNLYYLLLVSFSFLLFTCQKDELKIPEGEYTLEEGFTMLFNGDDNFKIHFDEVIQDWRFGGSFTFRLITTKDGIEQPHHELRTSNDYVTTLFYTPIGIYRFKMIEVTPSIDEVINGTTERYKIRFSLEEE